MRFFESNGKVANTLDKFCHTVFNETRNAGKFVEGKCRICGGAIKVYYCEERLYCVHCLECGTASLVKASNPQIAADLTISDMFLKMSRSVENEQTV